jgi:hypothetical protein
MQHKVRDSMLVQLLSDLKETTWKMSGYMGDIGCYGGLYSEG